MIRKNYNDSLLLEIDLIQLICEFKEGFANLLAKLIWILCFFIFCHFLLISGIMSLPDQIWWFFWIPRYSGLFRAPHQYWWTPKMKENPPNGKNILPRYLGKKRYQKRTDSKNLSDWANLSRIYQKSQCIPINVTNTHDMCRFIPINTDKHDKYPWYAPFYPNKCWWSDKIHRHSLLEPHKCR